MIKSIKINDDVWADLMYIKISCKASSLNQVIKDLIERRVKNDRTKNTR